jgi:hypothetical protein
LCTINYFNLENIRNFLAGSQIVLNAIFCFLLFRSSAKKSEIENKRKEEKMERERENRPGELLWGAYLVFSGELKMEEERKEKKKRLWKNRGFSFSLQCLFPNTRCLQKMLYLMDFNSMDIIKL